MKLALAGINHRTAPVEVREKLAFRKDEVPAALVNIRARGAKEALILSTCNRVEITAALGDGVSTDALLEALPSWDGLSLDAVRPYLYLLEETEAIRHIFRVASSLDSMIVGEPQILGQLKQAYVQARDQGAIGSVLDTVLTRAFSVAKRVRSETEIGRSAVSVGHAAVELAREIFGSLDKKRVLIIGAGKMSEAAVRHLVGAGTTEILITNRTPEHAAELARIFGGEVIAYESFHHRLAEVDITIASSAASEYVLDSETVRRAIDARRNQPMFFIDIAVPRCIQPDVNDVEHAFLYDMDDLQRLADRNLKARSEVARQAESIVEDEVSRLEARLRERDVSPMIVGLQQQLEDLRREVLERHRSRLGALTLEQEEALEALTRSIVSKIAHGPISEIRRYAALRRLDNDPWASDLMSAIRRMFQLRDR